MQRYKVAALYKFVELPDFEAIRLRLLDCCLSHDIRGTILLAREGINGTIAGRPRDLDDVLAYIRQDARFADLEHKESWSEDNPFLRMKVRLKREIVTMGAAEANPTRCVGEYVPPQDWNDLIGDPETLLIDTRNDYEVAIGTFEGALNPETGSFREFPQWFDANKDKIGRHKKIAMFCTGGIRCEKATAFLKAKGIGEVYHLQGGILKYLETVPEAQSKWRGECFVFDNRVSVGHGLAPGPYDLCHACRRPISEDDKASPHYEAGVSCPHCHDALSESDKTRFAARQKQVELARQRGEAHIAADQEAARIKKQARRAQALRIQTQRTQAQHVEHRGKKVG